MLPEKYRRMPWETAMAGWEPVDWKQTYMRGHRIREQFSWRGPRVQRPRSRREVSKSLT